MAGMSSIAPTRDAGRSEALRLLAGIERHPHALAVLGPALAPAGERPHAEPSHAYLFHGPAGVGKRAVARAFAAALLAEGAADPELVRERVLRGTHPDLTWVSPSGAAEMLVADIEQPVVAAAARTPFESARRVFVIEAAETMNENAGNRLLKTLEEPPAFAHLILLSDRWQDVLGTLVSRCQRVRFDPLPPEVIAASLTGVEPERALACARLAMGDAGLAALLAGEEGAGLRAAAESFIRAALGRETGSRPWQALLAAAKTAQERAGELAEERIAGELELLPAKERKRHEREGLEARRRAERRAKTETLERGLRLGELWLRDVLCICEGVPEAIHGLDRRDELEQDAEGESVSRLREAIELVGLTALSLGVNVSEELALEALAFRIEAL
jgi:DNA polymerase-3 subunit delta'